MSDFFEWYNLLQWTAMLLCILLPFLWKTSTSFRYYVKAFSVGGSVALVSIPFASGSLWRPRDVNNMKIGQWWLTRVTSYLNIKWELRGADKLKAISGPCIFVCNHQSVIDMIGMMHMWPERCVPMIKREMIYHGVNGVIGYLTGCVFIDRYNRKNAVETCTKAINYIKKNNIKLWMFPEGKRAGGKEMLPFKKGAFYMAVQGHLPIVPVVFSSYACFYNKERKAFLDDGHVIMEVLDSISTDGMQDDDVSALSTTTRSLMMKTYENISTEAAERQALKVF